MAQYISFDPKVEVCGPAVLSVTAGLGESALPIMAAHHIVDVREDGWYSQQEWLYALRDIGDGKWNAAFDLTAIGMKIPENAIFPPGIDSPIAALHSLDIAYHMNHRGGEIGFYRATVIDDTHIDMLCENPYPDDFDYGLIYGMVKRFCPKDMHFSVYHDDNAPCRQKGDISCLYHVVLQAV